MELIRFAAVIICAIGLVLYFVASNPKLARVGEIMFASGLFAVLLKL